MTRAPCLFCDNESAIVSMTLDDRPEFHCDECETTFTPDDVRGKIEAWSAVLKWVEASPFRCERPAGELRATG